MPELQVLYLMIVGHPTYCSGPISMYPLYSILNSRPPILTLTTPYYIKKWRCIPIIDRKYIEEIV